MSVSQNDAEFVDATTEREPPKARLGAILLSALRTVWDRLGLVVAVSVTWTLVASLPLSLGRWLPIHAPPIFHFLALVSIPLVVALPTAGVFSIAHRIATGEEALYTHLWQDGLQLLGPSFRLVLVQTGVAAILLTAFGFYLRMPMWLGRAALMACAYALLVWSMMLVYQWPALVAQEKGLFDEPDRTAKRGAFAAVRRSFYMALGRPFFTLSLLLILVFGAVLMAATLVLMALLGIGTIAILSTTAMRALLIEFRVLPPPLQQTPIPDELFRIADIKGEAGSRKSEVSRQ